jgi:hypothetical protein
MPTPVRARKPRAPLIYHALPKQHSTTRTTARAAPPLHASATMRAPAAGAALAVLAL